MGCDRVDLGDGNFAIVCSRGRRAPKCSVPGCDRPSAKQCDYPTKSKSGTCDKHLCAAHATSGGREIDYCPPHAKLVQAQQPLPIQRQREE